MLWYLFFYSHCSSFDHGEPFQVGFCAPLTCPHPFVFLSTTFCLGSQHVLGSSSIFSAPVQELTISWKSLGSFYWGMALRIQDLSDRCAQPMFSEHFLCIWHYSGHWSYQQQRSLASKNLHSNGPWKLKVILWTKCPEEHLVYKECSKILVTPSSLHHYLTLQLFKSLSWGFEQTGLCWRLESPVRAAIGVVAGTRLCSNYVP